MNGTEEVNIKSNGVILNMKESARSKMKETKDEHVSNVHSTKQDIDDDTLPMRTVHANQEIKVPSGRQAEPIKELINVAHKTNQTAKIMNFPPIDHDSFMSSLSWHVIFIYVLYFDISHVLLMFETQNI